MCGITGYINLNHKPIRDTRSMLQMLAIQSHRGPDDSGVRAFSLREGISEELPVIAPTEVAGNMEGMLGFNRLSILDLSPNGHQPMTSPNGKVILAMNGEIYNAFDYKKELIDWGYRFISTSDTEIVLALYLKYGFEKMLERLNGMFAIVIADLKEQCLFIARDRFGIKPMYFIENKEYLAFSSELKSFHFLPGFHFKLDESQLDEYLLFRNNLKNTLFQDIQVLEPGHYLRFSHENGVRKFRYFDVNDYQRNEKCGTDFAGMQDQLESWLLKSVQSQLMSDVKLGCQLSGGVDSSLVTWLANQNSRKGQFESVSIIFQDPRFSEEKYIDKVTKKLHIASHKFQLDATYYLQQLEKATWHFEAPINHPNTIGIYLLSQKAKEHVTVLLSGEGADEVFGGYSRYYDIAYPFLNRRFAAEIKHGITNPRAMLDYFNPSLRAILPTTFMSPSIAKSLYPDFNFTNSITPRSLLYNSLTGSPFTKQVKYELQSYLPDLLIRQDKMSMAHSIENRVPFLDNEVVANSFRIPEKFLVMRRSPEGANTEKYLLKKLTAGKFGQAFAFRDKMGFGIPVKAYFRNKSFTQHLQDSLLPGIRKRGILEYKIVNNWMNHIDTLNYREMEAFWIAISFETWATVYLDMQHENWNTSV
jgi:asparagine synthase (glutamine-hydrolysing)